MDILLEEKDSTVLEGAVKEESREVSERSKLIIGVKRRGYKTNKEKTWGRSN